MRRKKRLNGDSEREENTEPRTGGKRLEVLQGLLLFTDLTFHSDDDDFNVSDVIMSRIACSTDEWHSRFSLSHPFSIKEDSPPTCIH